MWGFPRKFGAGNESRTRDLNLGKVALYQLSYSRNEDRNNSTFFSYYQARRHFAGMTSEEDAAA